MANCFLVPLSRKECASTMAPDTLIQYRPFRRSFLTLTRQVCIACEQLEHVNPLPNALWYGEKRGRLTDGAECFLSYCRHTHRFLLITSPVRRYEVGRKRAKKNGFSPHSSLELDSNVTCQTAPHPTLILVGYLSRGELPLANSSAFTRMALWLSDSTCQIFKLESSVFMP